MDQQLLNTQPEFYINKTNKELQIMLERCIEQLKFEEAKAIETALIMKKEDMFQVNLKQSLLKITDMIGSYYEKWQKDVEQDNTNQKIEEAAIREKINRTFVNIKNSHIEQLTHLEKKYVLDILKAKDKPIKAQIDFENQAKKLAKEGDFDGAVLFREKANVAFSTEQKSRREAVDSYYDSKRNILTERQTNELSVLNEKLLSQLNDSLITLQYKQKEKEKHFMVLVKSLEQKEIQQLSASVKSKEQKQHIAETVSKHVRKELHEKTGIDDTISVSQPVPQMQTKV